MDKTRWLDGLAVTMGLQKAEIANSCKQISLLYQQPKYHPAWALYLKIPVMHQFMQVIAHSMPWKWLLFLSITAAFHFLFRSAAALHTCSAQWWGRLELQGLDTAKLCVWQPVPTTVQGYPVSSNKCCLSRSTGRVSPQSSYFRQHLPLFKQLWVCKVFKTSLCVVVVGQDAWFPLPTLPGNTSAIPAQMGNFQPPNLHLFHHMLSQGSNKCLTLLGLGAFTAADTNRVVCKWNTSSEIASSLHAQSHRPGSVTACLGRSVPP